MSRISAQKCQVLAVIGRVNIWSTFDPAGRVSLRREPESGDRRR
jgi:hypothetical protein